MPGNQQSQAAFGQGGFGAGLAAYGGAPRHDDVVGSAIALRGQ